MSMKNFSDTIGNRTCDLSTCSAMPQPTAPPRTPFINQYVCKMSFTVLLIKRKAIYVHSLSSRTGGNTMYFARRNLLDIGKGKGHHRTGHEDPEGEKRHSCTLSLTLTIDGVGFQRHGSFALLPGKTRYHCIGDWVGLRTGLDG